MKKTKKRSRKESRKKRGGTAPRKIDTDGVWPPPWNSRIKERRGGKKSRSKKSTRKESRKKRGGAFENPVEEEEGGRAWAVSEVRKRKPMLVANDGMGGRGVRDVPI